MPHRLGECEEAAGFLLQVAELEGLVVAVFFWGTVAFPSEMEERLRGLIGKKITVFRLDGCYYIREILEQH